jgi:SDR family mycofactocin-dependent oxidoreductase
VGRVDGKVALVTGAARGQGRAHALRLAGEGADIVALDALADIGSVTYPMATEADMAETVGAVEALGRRIVHHRVDVREQEGLDAAVADATSQLGGLDIVVANAGIASFGPAWELPEQSWQDMIDINLSGAWRTVKAAAPVLVEQGRGGSIVLTSSTAGLKGMANIAHYSAAKHGLVGLMRTLANELGPHRIRVNTVHPTNVATDMILNDTTFKLFRPDLAEPTQDDMIEAMSAMGTIPVPWIDPLDVANAVLWLVSDEARYVTGVTLPIDAGCLVK